MNQLIQTIAVGILLTVFVLSPIAVAEDDPMVPDIFEQYGRVLDNLTNADTLSDIPDPIDAEPNAEEPDVSEPPNTQENMDWESHHPNGPF